MEKKEEHSYLSIFRKTWMLISFNAAVSFTISAEFINLLFLSRLLWPGDAFHGIEMGFLISIRLWIDGVSSLFWGYFIDRIPRKRLWAITTILTGFVIIFNGTLPVGNGNSDYPLWVIARAFIGVFMSAGGPAIHSLANDSLNKNARSKFFGLVSVGWGVFGAIATLFSALIFQIGFWREYFYFAGGVFVVLGLYLITLYDEPKRGIQEEALINVLKNDSVEYKYKINKETLKSTILSKTNILVLAEGLFSNIFFGVLDLVLLPYIQDSPRNISPTVTGLISLLFGLPGAIFGSLYFAKLSDKLGKKDIKNRVKFIIISLVLAFILTFSLFLLPLPHLTPEQGNNFIYISQFMGFYGIGIIMFFIRIDFSLFIVNQPPIIQEINLPEAQGTIRSWGQMVEIASYGSGPIIAGFLLDAMQNNYFLAIQSMIWLSIPGILMWVFALKTIDKDRDIIQSILEKRTNELKLIKNNK